MPCDNRGGSSLSQKVPGHLFVCPKPASLNGCFYLRTREGKLWGNILKDNSNHFFLFHIAVSPHILQNLQVVKVMDVIGVVFPPELKCISTECISCGVWNFVYFFPRETAISSLVVFRMTSMKGSTARCEVEGGSVVEVPVEERKAWM